MVANYKTKSNFVKFVWCACPQIAVKVDKLFSVVGTDIREIIDYNSDGEDAILTIFYYVEAMSCQL